MATYTGVRVVSATLAGTTVDTITMAGDAARTVVYNRHATQTIWATIGKNPPDPTVAGNECIPILPMTKEVIGGGGVSSVIKILGNGEPYTVFRGG